MLLVGAQKHSDKYLEKNPNLNTFSSHCNTADSSLFVFRTSQINIGLPRVETEDELERDRPNRMSIFAFLNETFFEGRDERGAR